MPDLRCPRCRYDMSWVPDQWTSSCPSSDTCPECGLTFEWRDVYSPELVAPPWFVEHPNWRPRFAIGRTFARLVLPWRFWRRVPMAVPLRPRRLSGFVLACSLWLFASYVVVATMYGVRLAYWRGIGWTPNAQGATVWTFLGSHLRSVFSIRDREWDLLDQVRSGWVTLGLFFLLMPCTLALLPASLRRAKVQSRHLVRAGAYSCALLVLIGGAQMARTLFYAIRPDIFHDVLRHVDVVMIGAAIFWLVMFWWHAIRSYRLERSFLIVVCMFIVGGLCSFVLTFMCYVVAVNGVT